ncbi:MAG TPA: methyltransferase domain-containing protein [Cytophagales bacterium]|nr:methyltransferase domain-containing protein [Cytophagales bacterium]
MKWLNKRSYEPELLDDDRIPIADLFQNLKEIALVNKYLGGNKITIDGIKQLITTKTREYHIIDIGCGAGDNLKAIHQWGKEQGYRLKLYGLDIKADAVQYAQKNTDDLSIHYIVDSYENLESIPYSFDIAICCLFCHHFHEDALKKLIQILSKKCNIGFVINDLHRHWIAYYFISWVAKLFSKSYLFKNDAPLSVARAFKKKDLDLLLNEHGPYHIQWKWAYRWLVVKYKGSW